MSELINCVNCVEGLDYEGRENNPVTCTVCAGTGKVMSDESVETPVEPVETQVEPEVTPVE